MLTRSHAFPRDSAVTMVSYPLESGTEPVYRTAFSCDFAITRS